MKALRAAVHVGAAVLLTACAQVSPYAGQEARGIKAMSADEIDSYLQGKGMGFAKPAELNGYPGPMHVLELADKLKLTPDQRAATAALLQSHKTEVRSLGHDFVNAEAELDKAFASGQIAPKSLETALIKSADLHRRIREAHLATHLKQTALLTPEQIRDYTQARGYGSHAHH